MSKVHIYCINLDSRKDRWNRFQSQPVIADLLAGQSYPNYEIERFSAVVGKDVDIQNDSRISVRTKKNILYQKRRSHEDLDSAGGVGCYLSHLAIWEKFMKTGAEYCIVLEDDALIPDTFITDFETSLKELKESNLPRGSMWNLSIPHGTSIRTAIDHEDTLFLDGWAMDIVCPTTGYIMFRESAAKLIENALPIDGHVDMYIWRCTQIGIIHTVHYNNLMLRQVIVKIKDTNIQGGRCDICDLPTTLDAPPRSFLKNSDNSYAAPILVGLAVAGMALVMLQKRR
jgi:glycosyl transferase family 25